MLLLLSWREGQNPCHGSRSNIIKRRVARPTRTLAQTVVAERTFYSGFDGNTMEDGNELKVGDLPWR